MLTHGEAQHHLDCRRDLLQPDRHSGNRGYTAWFKDRRYAEFSIRLEGAR
jgi:hypothetical protein